MSDTPNAIWIGRNDSALGPHPIEKIRALHAEGSLRADDLLWWDGQAEWVERDVALAQLGVEAARATSAPPPMPSRPVVPELPRAPARVARVTSQRSEGAGASAALLGFAALIGVAVLAAAAFAFLRVPNGSLPSFGGRKEMIDALAAAGMYKTAYAEYVMSTDQVPQSLADLGMSTAPYGSMRGVRLEAGTLLLDTARGVLALQPYRNANYQIWFRCGRAAPPAGMEPLGMIDAASATTVTEGELPDDCR
jgi:hypothetical protein